LNHFISPSDTLKGVFLFLALYPSYFKPHVRWLLSLLGPSMGLASARPLQAAFKSAPCRFVTRIIDCPLTLK
ncbi:TPA: hypothetical protein ACPZFU_000626, partial [Yersinia enterocolitica]